MLSPVADWLGEEEEEDEDTSCEEEKSRWEANVTSTWTPIENTHKSRENSNW